MQRRRLGSRAGHHAHLAPPPHHHPSAPAPCHTPALTQVMQDALHPNAAGHELLAQCLDPLITKLMQRPVGPSASLATKATGDE